MKRAFIFFLISYLFNLTLSYGQDVCPGTPFQITSGGSYTQDFESWTTDCSNLDPAGDIPDTHWSNSKQSPLANNQQGWRISTYSAWTSGFLGFTPYPSGSHSARFKTASTSGTVAAYMDLYLDCSASPGTQQLTFNYLNSNSSTTINYDSLRIMLSTDGVNFTQLGSTFTQTPGWVLETLTFNSSTATTIIRFVGTSYASQNGSSDIGLDEVTVGTLNTCSGTPTATTLSPAGTINLSACSPTQTFSLTTNYSAVSGIGYQWQQSADGVTFTPISGATNATYTGTFSAPGYINCIVSCTTSGQSVTSDTDTIAVSPQGYAALPYAQNFDNTWVNACGSTDDDAPDAYWGNSLPNALGSSGYGWRRSDYTSWGTVGLVNFTPYPSGNYSARYHTDGAGSAGTGNLDVYLDCSSSGGNTIQTTFDYLNDGGADMVTVYLSTNGAAGPFTLLNTYTTATNWTPEVFTFTSSSPTTVLRFTGNLGVGNGSSDIGLDNLDIATLIACSGTPNAGTANPSNTSLSPCNASQTFTLAGYDGMTGLTFQWQQSTDGINFTAVSGETNTSYTGTFAVGTTYVNCLVTCTASGNSTTSSTDTVTVSSQSYLAVTAGSPYIQGFENQWINKCATDDAPDNYWINTPSTGNDSWRRSDDGASASWTSPSGGAYTPAGSNANGASSSYSARLHSYEGAEGTSGTFDLYLDLSAAGSKQVSYDYINTSGADSLSVMISTTGPTGPFTEVDAVTTSASWATRTFTTNAISNTCVLRFMGYTDFGNSDIGVDNISVSILGSCAGTPAIGTVSPSGTITLSGCSPNQVFTLSDVNVGVGGLTYQWQQSSDGVTYTAISGATNLTYNGGFGSGTTYINCLVTCTNSNLSVTSNTDTVNVTPQPYASLPYVQNFDDVWADHCGTDNEAPDSNWINSQPNVLISGETSWRRSDYTLWNEVAEYQPCPTGNYCAMFRTGGTSAADGPASQSLSLYIDCSTSPGTQQLTFYYDNNGGNVSSNQDNLTVSYSTSGPGGPFTQLVNINGTTGWTPDTLSFPSSSATTIIRFTGNAVFGSNNSDVAIDAVNVATLTNCTGTPATASTSPSNDTLSSCNPNETLTLSGAYAGIGGLTYQWQQSTDGVTFTPVSGATGGTYTQAFPGGTTYMNCVVTCTSSGLFVTSNTDTITVDVQGYFAVANGSPYIQDFENQWISKCATDDVPDNYWINTPATGNPSWRRNDDGASASWNAPNGAAYSPTGSNANGASSTYSARFHGDYVNGIAGATFDLYLDLSAAGTKQVSYDYIDNSTTKGLGVYLSTNGLAGPFTEVDTAGSSTSWATRTFTTTATSNQCVLRFLPVGDFSHDMGLDNVSVSILSSCTGTPTAGSVTPSGTISLTACNANQTFAISANNIGITGITYQWQQSTDGVTYAPISGATSLAYTGAFSNSTTYVNCQVTCTNSGLSSTSNTDTVVLTPQGYYAVTAGNPYTQGFENSWISKCATDDAADNYWINTPSAGNDSWRRSDDGVSAAWNLPTGGAYTPAGSNANGASSSYSARFHSYEGAAGTSGTYDLYLDLSAAGTKQVSYDYINTSGADSLSVLISTTGPAGPFTRLDGVITSSTWSTRTFTTDATSNDCVLRFMGYADFGLSDIGLDNISVSVLTQCSGTPTAGTVSPSGNISLSACNTNQVFVLSGNYTGIGGITYQWEQSTNGVNYTPISGATNITYTGTFTSDTVYLNCVVTCTSSGLFSTSNTDTIIVSPQSYASIPYTQDFESWMSVCGTDNEAPDQNWVNGVATPILSAFPGWRRSDYNWTAGANGFSPYPSGNYSARFHDDGAASGSVNLDLYINCSTITGNKLLSFYYHNTAGSDNMGVYLSVDSGANFTLLNTYTTASSWTADTLPVISNSPKTIIRFTGTSIGGSNGSSDIGLDLVQVYACGGSTALTASGPLSFCSGGSVILSPDTTTADNTYQWMLNGNAISGATANVYTANQAGIYTVAVNGSGSCPDTTFADTVAIFTPPAPAVTETSGQNLTTTTYATYQWYLNGQPVNGATSQIDTPAVNGIYYVVVTDSNGCSGQSAIYTLTDLGMGVPSVANGLQNVSMYPDPNTGNFIVKGTLSNVDAKQVVFEVTDVIGQVVYKTNKMLRSGAWETQVSLGNAIANGVYLLHVTIDGQSQVIKFIVSR